MWLAISDNGLVFRSYKRMVNFIIFFKPNLFSFIRYYFPFFLYSYLLLGFSNQFFNVCFFELFVISLSFLLNSLVGFLINDYFDFEQDLVVGKGNFRSILEVNKYKFLIALLSSISLFLVGTISILLSFVLLVQLILFFLYSYPKFRFKERGFLGVITDALYAHVTPAVFLSLFFFIQYKQQPNYYFLGFSIINGIYNILSHQRQDLANDVKTDQRTFVFLNEIFSYNLMVVLSLFGATILTLFAFNLSKLFILNGMSALQTGFSFFCSLIISLELFKHNILKGMEYQKIFIIYFSLLLFFEFFNNERYVLMILLVHPYFTDSIFRFASFIFFIFLRYTKHAISYTLVTFIPLLFNYLLFLFYLVVLFRDVRRKPIRWTSSQRSILNRWKNFIINFF